MEYSESKKKYNLEYAKKKLKSINGYIKKAIDERMQRDKGNQ